MKRLPSRVLALLFIFVVVFSGVTNLNFIVLGETVGYGSGSLIIPMDVTYQNYGMWRAYGLVYYLLSNGIPVHWAIEPTKTFSGPDFTAATKDLRLGTTIGSYAYSGGPFIIDSAYAAQAKPLIQVWWAKYANQPNVHEATSSFTANVDIILRSPPRIANDATNAGIAIAYYNIAGIPDLNGNIWTTASPNLLDMKEIANGVLFTNGTCSRRNFDIFVTTHNNGYTYSLTDPNNLGTKTYAQLDFFVQQGGGWTALCHSIISNENAMVNLYTRSSPAVRALFKSTVNGGLLTSSGFTSIANTGGTWTVYKPNLPLAQSVTTPSTVQALPGGSVQDWLRTSVNYYGQTEKVGSFVSGGSIYDWAITGVCHGGDGLGKATFLGGHSYSTSLPYSSNFEAPYLRFFYNSLFFNGAAVAKLDLSTTPTAVPQNVASTITLELMNVGSSTATSTSDVTIKLASGVTYLSTTYGPNPVSVVSNPDGTTSLNWGSSLGSIADNTTVLSVQVQLTPDASGEKKIANLSARYGDVYAESFTADICRALNVYPGPQPQISKTPDTQGPFYKGQTVTWTLTYQNTASQVLSTTQLLNSVVEDILPVGFAYKTATPTPASILPLGDGTTRIRWNVGTLSAGASGTITLTAHVGQNLGINTNNASFSGQDSNSYSYRVTDTADVTVTQPEVNVTKTVSPTGPVDVTTPGQVLTYSVSPHYGGTSLIDNVLVSDPIPAYTTYVAGSMNAGGTYGYTPLPKVDGLDTTDTGTTTNSITTSPTTAAVGGTVTVTMTLTNNNGGAITNIIPSLAESRGLSTVSAPTPPSIASLANKASASFTFTCTFTDIGEATFVGDATGTFNSEDYSFSTASSNTVLATSTLNTSPANDVVTWRLGSNVAGSPGEYIVNGRITGVYAFRGASTAEFSKYDVPYSVWQSEAPLPQTEGKGGSLTTDGDGTIYASRGLKSKNFYKFDISTNTWTPLASSTTNFNDGGSIQYLEVGGVKYVYAIHGNGNVFRRYNIASDTWTNLANTPATVRQGGALTTDGTYLYAFRGANTKDFWRYNIGTNTWTAMTSAPGNVKWGGALTHVGNYIYAFQGGTTTFWRYSISGNSWTAMTNAPGTVSAGGSLTTDGTYLYALQGGTGAFWRYTISSNTWTTLATDNFLGTVGQGGAVVYDAGITPEGRFTVMNASPSLVYTGETITVTMEASSSTAINNVVPTAPVITSTGGATATLVSGPTPASQNVPAGGTVNFTWVYTATAGSMPGSLKFTATQLALEVSNGTMQTLEVY